MRIYRNTKGKIPNKQPKVVNNELWNYINSKNLTIIEGSSTIQDETDDLIKYCKDKKNIMEIGFNAGNSAVTFLKNSSASVTSFDIGEWDVVNHAKTFVDMTYPNRHTLIIGDSTVKVPEYSKNNSGKTFDLIFIDGGHDYSVALADLENCRLLSTPETIVIMDDVRLNSSQYSWTEGPTKVIEEKLKEKTIFLIEEKKYKERRGIAVFKYI